MGEPGPGGNRGSSEREDVSLPTPSLILIPALLLLGFRSQWHCSFIPESRTRALGVQAATRLPTQAAIPSHPLPSVHRRLSDSSVNRVEEEKGTVVNLAWDG